MLENNNINEENIEEAPLGVEDTIAKFDSNLNNVFVRLWDSFPEWTLDMDILELDNIETKAVFWNIMNLVSYWEVTFSDSVDSPQINWDVYSDDFDIILPSEISQWDVINFFIFATDILEAKWFDKTTYINSLMWDLAIICNKLYMEWSKEEDYRTILSWAPNYNREYYLEKYKEAIAANALLEVYAELYSDFSEIYWENWNFSLELLTKNEQEVNLSNWNSFPKVDTVVLDRTNIGLWDMLEWGFKVLLSVSAWNLHDYTIVENLETFSSSRELSPAEKNHFSINENEMPDSNGELMKDYIFAPISSLELQNEVSTYINSSDLLSKELWVGFKDLPLNQALALIREYPDSDTKNHIEEILTLEFITRVKDVFSTLPRSLSWEYSQWEEEYYAELERLAWMKNATKNEEYLCTSFVKSSSAFFRFWWIPVTSLTSDDHVISLITLPSWKLIAFDPTRNDISEPFSKSEIEVVWGLIKIPNMPSVNNKLLTVHSPWVSNVMNLWTTYIDEKEALDLKNSWYDDAKVWTLRDDELYSWIEDVNSLRKFTLNQMKNGDFESALWNIVDNPDLFMKSPEFRVSWEYTIGYFFATAWNDKNKISQIFDSWMRDSWTFLENAFRDYKLIHNVLNKFWNYKWVMEGYVNYLNFQAERILSSTDEEIIEIMKISDWRSQFLPLIELSDGAYSWKFKNNLQNTISKSISYSRVDLYNRINNALSSDDNSKVLAFNSIKRFDRKTRW